MDTKTGMVVKSLANYKEGGVAKTYETVYQVLEFATPKVRVPPTNLTSTKEFVSFYTGSQQDYYERASCAARSGQDRDFCFASLAYSKNEPEMCGRVSDAVNVERCYVILAQVNADERLCAGLSRLADDCYIAVANENGNFSLCRLLSNQSLGESCNAAATKGQKKFEQQEELERSLLAKRNCAVSADCAVKGSFGQFCVARNQTVSASGTAFASCYAGLPCGCNKGFCSFEKNESFYQCMNDKEDAELEAHIKSISGSNNNANQGNSTG